MISLAINDSGLQSAIDRASALGTNLRPLMARLGKQTEVEIRKHFRLRNSGPNAHGWPKKNFWEREGAQNTALTAVTANSATVSIASAAIAHKITGGTIFPKRGAALAIPLTAEAYAAGSPREWDKPEKLFRPKGRRFLAIRDAGGALRVMYVLVRSVTQDADEKTLPDMNTLSQKLAASAHDYLDKRLRGTAA